MSNVTRLPRAHREPDPQDLWPGVAPLDRKGVEISQDLLYDLEAIDNDGTGLANQACLEDWPRMGAPTRNIVAERLAVARAAGPEAEAAFLTVLSDFVGMTCQASIPDSGRYADLYELDG